MVVFKFSSYGLNKFFNSKILFSVIIYKNKKMIEVYGLKGGYLSIVQLLVMKLLLHQGYHLRSSHFHYQKIVRIL